jgi:CheY-like chemotaxis protein
MSDTNLLRLVDDIVAEVRPAAGAAGLQVIVADHQDLPTRVRLDEGAVRRSLLQALDFVIGALPVGTIRVRLSMEDEDRGLWRVSVECLEPADDGREAAGTFTMIVAPAPIRPDTPHRRVLVVDDSTQQRMLVRAYLADTAHSVIEAADGAEAIDRVRTDGFDVVFMDLQMPGMNGVDAIRALRTHEAGTDRPPARIIALTALGASDDVTEAEEAGADECLAKPLSRDAVLAMVDAPFASPAALEVVEALNEPSDATAPVPDLPDGLTPGQLLDLALYQLHTILASPDGTQVERFRLFGQSLGAAADPAGLHEVAALAQRLANAATNRDLRQAQTAARTLQAWITRVERASAL